jgi:hypothetical protein
MRLVVATAVAALVLVGCSETAQKSAGTPPWTATASAHLSAAQKARVQATLQAAIDRYSTEFAAGQIALSHTKNNDFYNWRHSTNIENDVQTYLDAFSTADANYTADNEPSAMPAWRSDMSTVQADIVLWVQVAVDWQIGRRSDAELTAASATVNKDFDAARADLAQILAAS